MSISMGGGLLSKQTNMLLYVTETLFGILENIIDTNNIYGIHLLSVSLL